MKQDSNFVPDLGDRTGDQQEKTIFSLGDLLTMDVKELPCLFEPIFIKSGIAVLYGGSDAGKSTLLRQMAMCVSTGRDFLGWKYKGEHHRAIYFSSEDDDRLTAIVTQRYNKTMQLPKQAYENLRFSFEIDPDTIATKVAEMLKAQPADLVVIDALADAFNGKSLNDNKEIRAFYAPFKAIAKECNCLIIFNHHSGKRTDAYSPTKDNSLGSQAIEAAPRLAIELRPDPDNAEIKHFCVVKCNYLSSSYKTQSYALKMDENFVFSTTGERSNYADLAKNNRPQQKGKRWHDYDEAHHRTFIASTFAETSEMNQSQLAKAIAIEFEISTKTAIENWIPVYLKKGMIKTGKKTQAKNAILYKSNL